MKRFAKNLEQPLTYLPFYHLKKKPFSISPDPQFLWLSEKHLEAFEVLKDGILERDGCVMLTGDIGTGKTTLIKRLVRLDDVAAIFVTINDPDLELLDFFNILSAEFQMGRRFTRKEEFIASFKHFLLNAFSSYKKVLLIIDEAQRLNHEILIQTVELSDLKMAGRKLLKVFFVGQVEFSSALIREENRGVLKSISAHYYLQPLSEQETRIYIEHRLSVAGAQTQIFTPEAIVEIFRLAKGYPRAINVICDNALRCGFRFKSYRINADIVKKCKLVFHDNPKIMEEFQKEMLAARVEATIASNRQNSHPVQKSYLEIILFAIIAAIAGIGFIIFLL